MQRALFAFTGGLAMALVSSGAQAGPAIGNAALRLELQTSGPGVAARLIRVSDGFALADGPMVFRYEA